MGTWLKRFVSMVLAACMMMGVCAFGEEAEIADAAAEPVVVEQATEEPVAEEPVVEEPVTEEPVTGEPVVEEPVVEEPVVEEPVVEEPVVEEPVVEEPVVEEPVVEEPVTEEPVVEEPVVEEPVVEEPVVEEPVTEEPVVEEPVVEEPVVEEPVVEEPVVEEPVVEEPVVEEPVVEEPVVEEPVVEEPVVEEPVVEESVVEEAEKVLTESESQDESLLTGYTERYDNDDGSYNIYEYDDNTGDWISGDYYDENGTRRQHYYENTTEYYDENGSYTGRSVSNSTYDENGKYTGYRSDRYDANGNLTYSYVESRSFDAEGNLTGSIDRSYDGDGNLTYITQYTYSEDEGWEVNNTDPLVNTTRFVIRMYNVVLGRTPDQAGLDYWVNSLMNKEKAAGEIVDGFFNSQEYKNFDKSNWSIVNDCYYAMLDRWADEEGEEYWVNRLDIGMTQQTVLHGFVRSQEFMALCDSYGIDYGNIGLTAARDQNYERTYFVYRLYANCLGREPDEAGQEDWCQQLMNGVSGSSVAYGFIFSQELQQMHLDNDDYVEMMYQTIMGRESDEGGKEDWVDQLNYTRTREHIFNGFLLSTEFAQQCAVAEINVGDQIEEPDGSTEWQMNVNVLRLCNEQRRANGLDDLTTREDLWQDVAMVRANELVTLFSHDRPNGTDCFTAWDDAGMDNCWTVGENIAQGQASAEEVVNAWMNSPGHRANILDEDYENLATGYVSSGPSYSQNFGSFWREYYYDWQYDWEYDYDDGEVGGNG